MEMEEISTKTPQDGDSFRKVTRWRFKRETDWPFIRKVWWVLLFGSFIPALGFHFGLDRVIAISWMGAVFLLAFFLIVIWQSEIGNWIRLKENLKNTFMEEIDEQDQQ